MGLVVELGWAPRKMVGWHFTNFRELENLPHPNTRGDLPLCFLQSNKSPQEFAERVLKEAHQYNGFNLILPDICTSFMVYVFNRPKLDLLSVTPGIHVLTNASLDTPWPKAERLRHNFKELVDQYGEHEECMLPGIHPPELERPLSSIFVDVEFSLGRYGTKSSSVIFLKSNKEVTFYEKHLDQEKWKEKMVTYEINET
ncbi:Transport and Golgi organization protein 2 [Sesbania bispinosa]|nr:Transport and Golgi organization protein 2 [Sesbania bispinosa]